MKIYIFFFLLLFSFSPSYSQQWRGRVGFGLNLDRSFDNAGFASVNSGIEYQIGHHFCPEIAVDYFFGVLKDKVETNNLNQEANRLTQNFSAINLSFCPKIIFDDPADHLRFQIIPKCNFYKTYAKGTFDTLDSSGSKYNTDSDKFEAFSSSFGIAIGLVLAITEDHSQAIALNLTYNNIDFGNAINGLKFDNHNLHSNQSLGFEVLYYFSFKKIKPKP